MDKSFDDFCKDVVEKGFIFLPVDITHIIKSAKLPFHHRDPFDRIIVAQAISENLDFVSKDDIMELYLENQIVRKIW